MREALATNRAAAGGTPAIQSLVFFAGLISRLSRNCSRQPGSVMNSAIDRGAYRAVRAFISHMALTTVSPVAIWLTIFALVRAPLRQHGRKGSVPLAVILASVTVAGLYLGLLTTGFLT